MADNTTIRKDAESLYEIKEVGIEYSYIMLRERSVINCHEALTGIGAAQRLAEWLLRNQPAEHGIVICVDNMLRPVCYSTVSIGTGNTTVLPVATIAQIGLLSAARGIIFAHNHPTGDIRPSSQDRAATYRLHAALELIGLELVDSLIIGSGYEIPPVYSFREDTEDPSNPWNAPAAGVSLVADNLL